MRVRFLLAIFVMTGLAVSGCLGGDGDASADPASDPTGPAAFDEETGGIEGVVTDEEAKPVAGAQVGVLGLALETVTDADGRFVFDNVAPGRQSVVVQKLGYESASRAVEVVAGQSVSLQFTIAQIVVHEAYHLSIPKTGYFECTWRYSAVLVGASGPCGYTNVNGTTGNPLDQYVFTNSERKWNYGADPGAMSVLNEMVWTAGSAATGDNLRIFFSYADRSSQHTFCQADGFSPLVMKWEREEVDEDSDWECEIGSEGNQPSDEPDTIDLEEGMKLQTFVSVGVARVADTSTGQGFAYDQRFEIWFSMFYWEPAPADFSALPDA